MIQDINPAVFNNEFSRKREPEAEDTVFAFDSTCKKVLARVAENVKDAGTVHAQFNGSCDNSVGI
ncbi:MAG: hypothetical protein GX685_04440, partial [Clostridiales bacterium]|nr:hypothetical protein [Clostridiales bacterium]